MIPSSASSTAKPSSGSAKPTTSSPSNTSYSLLSSLEQGTISLIQQIASAYVNSQSQASFAQASSNPVSSPSGPKSAPSAHKMNFLLSKQAEKLFELLKLILAVKDESGMIEVGDENAHDKIFVIKNLHLAFPTVHKTLNPLARHQELVFTGDDVKSIREDAERRKFMAKALVTNLRRFLGITIDLKGSVHSFKEIAFLFNPLDPNNSNFSKALSRAMQAAILFNIFEKQTVPIVLSIVQTMRKQYPGLGIVPSGQDMILESPEMKYILQQLQLPGNYLTQQMNLLPSSKKSSSSPMTSASSSASSNPVSSVSGPAVNKMSFPLSKQAEKLFELLKLIFAVKDQAGMIDVGNGNALDKIFVATNLHLAFPTVHKTQNPSARYQELAFTAADVNSIRADVDRQRFLAEVLVKNLEKFLGIAIDQNGNVKLNQSVLAVFNPVDLNHSGFPKTLSRAMQAAILFNIFDKQTVPIVLNIVQTMRNHCPGLGILPTGQDAILESPEMKYILQQFQLPEHYLTQQMNLLPSSKISSPSPVIAPGSSASSNPVSSVSGSAVNKTSFPLSKQAEKLFELLELIFAVIDQAGTIDVENGNGHDTISVARNLHLAFPTVHTTQNQMACHPELVFTAADINSIRADADRQRFLAEVLVKNLEKFLGIAIDQNGNVKLNQSVLAVFNPVDLNHSGFPKTLSRAMQAAILFDIFDKQTIPVVLKIVQTMRNHCPGLGILASGQDAILESPEMKYILQQFQLSENYLTQQMNLLPSSKESSSSSMIAPMSSPSGSGGASLSISDARQPITDYLKKYFEIDSEGFLVSPLMDLTAIIKIMTSETEQKTLAHCFYQVARNGDAGYAYDLRAYLAGLGIGSSQVAKGNPQRVLQDPIRPHSHLLGRVSVQHDLAHTRPPSKPGANVDAPAYTDLWKDAIWRGYRDFRTSEFSLPSVGSFAKRKKDREDNPITAFQLNHYERSVQRIYELHERGQLFGRVTNPQEGRYIAADNHLMGNDILSTTLWPSVRSFLQMILFSEYGKETVGLLLDPLRASAEDFGLAFSRNAGTANSGFSSHKQNRHDGAVTWRAQQELLQDLNTIAQNGGDVSFAMPQLRQPDRQHWDLPKAYTRDGIEASSDKAFSNTIFWNEMTFYRGVEGDLFVGLFVKSDSESFSHELKNLLILQDHIRRTKGRFIPIFKFDGAANLLTEIPPNALLLNILGVEKFAVVPRLSQLTKALDKAGITEQLAIDMSKQLPQEGAIKMLFDLQLLMYNLKDSSGSVSILENGIYTPIRIIDNLHLVFPTIHKTQNTTAQSQDLFFTSEDVEFIHKNPALRQYLALSLKESLGRFLGITIDDQGRVQFDQEILKLFDRADVKKSDVAKILARAMQAAVLFNIFDDRTIPAVLEIVRTIRTSLPHLGILPTGIDMILGSFEMQAILKQILLPENCLTKNMAFLRGSSSNAPLEKFDPGLNQIDPFTPETVVFPSADHMEKFFSNYGIHLDGSIDQEEWKKANERDPLFLESETNLLEALRWLNVIDSSRAVKILGVLRNLYPDFGFSAEGKDLFHAASDALIKWIKDAQEKRKPEIEFPFEALDSLLHSKQQDNPEPSSSAPISGRRRGPYIPAPNSGRRRGVAAPQPNQPGGSRRRNYQGGEGSVPFVSPSKVLLDQLKESKVLKQKFHTLLGWQNPQNDVRFAAARALGLIDPQGNWLWATDPEFYLGDKQKPSKPYISVKDMLGQFVTELMTGPAMDPERIKEDQASVRVYHDRNLIPSGQLNRFLTHTLAVTTDGDDQVIRANGNQYHRHSTPPGGGHIEFHPGNEKFDFRRTRERRFYKDAAVNPYPGMGGYAQADLMEVQKYDEQLLSDEERRKKCAGMLMAGYITVSAQGGFGSPRVPLERPYRVFFLNTAGPQFEKYGKGAVTNSDGTQDLNELEASDFIIKQNAPENKMPLFRDYYPQGSIPSHESIKKPSQLDDGNWDASYVQLQDGAFFNREAFQRAIHLTFDKRVAPVLWQAHSSEPYYLKATLFGGGFFAKAGSAGDLRSEVVYAMLKAYCDLLEKGQVPAGSAIEFPRYGKWEEIDQPLRERLLAAAAKNKVEIIWTDNGDLCDFTPQTSKGNVVVDPAKFEQDGRLILLNAGDAMSWVGNESSSASVEAMIANNSNLRLVFNWWANPLLLEEKTHCPL